MSEDTPRILDELGFTVGGTHEAILTTVNVDGSYNAAPMGISRTDEKCLEIRPFHSSLSHRNLLREPRACINVTDDPGLYLVTAFKDEEIAGFARPDISEDMRLSSCDAWIHVEASKRREVSEIRSSYDCTVISVEAPLSLPRVFSRGRAEAIEAAIHATRIEVYTKEKKRDEVERLISRFSACKGVIERVSPRTSVEVRVVDELARMIDRWRDEA